MMAELINAERSDLFDVLAYVAFAESPISREKRVMNSKDEILSHYESKQQKFLAFVLYQYIGEGVGELALENLPDLLELKYHSINDATAELGNAKGIREAFTGFQTYLYQQDK